MSSYLMQHYDPGIPVGEETNKELEKEEQERLHHLWSVASVSVVIPRRLGGDASREELASDKKISKRVGWAAVQSYRAWGGTRKTANRDAEVEKEGAQVRWEKWWPEHEAWLIQRRQYYATRGLKRDPLWAKSAIVKINNEIDWLNYAMRGPLAVNLANVDAVVVENDGKLPDEGA